MARLLMNFYLRPASKDPPHGALEKQHGKYFREEQLFGILILKKTWIIAPNVLR